MTGDAPDGILPTTTKEYDADTGKFLDRPPDFRYTRLRHGLITATTGVYHDLFSIDFRAHLKSLVLYCTDILFVNINFRWVPTTGSAIVFPHAGALCTYGITDATKGFIYVPLLDDTNDYYCMGFADLLIPSDGGALQIYHASGSTIDVYYIFNMHTEKP